MKDYELYDFRYPFSSTIDYLGGMFFLKLEGLHLTLAMLALFYFIYKVMSDNKISLTYKISIIYFSITIYINPVFTLSISFAEIFGILATILFLYQKKYYANYISTYMFIFFVFSFIHYLNLVANNDTIYNNYEFKHIAVILKIFVLATNISILFYYTESKEMLNKAIKYVVFAVNIAIITYFIQILVFISGTTPYGSFSPAGWAESIIPSFGSVSIERGHFGKFLVPLFPLYLYVYIKLNYKRSFIIFLMAAFLNLSASSYVMILLYIFISIFFLRKDIGYKIIITISSILISIVILYSSQIYILFQKVYELGIIQNEGGGRSFSVLWDMLLKYPYGFGYGGSSYRYLPGITDVEFNNPIASYFGQLSFFGIFLFFIFIFTLYKIYNSSKYIKLTHKLEYKILLMSMLMIVVIFAIDILWFVPNVWLPIIIWSILINIEKKG